MSNSRLKRTIFQKPTFIPEKGAHKGKELRFVRKIKGTDYWVAKEVKYFFPEYYYLHKNEVDIFDRIGIDDTFQERVKLRLSVKWLFLKMDLAGTSPFISHEEDGSEYMLAKRVWLAKLLFPGATIKQGYET